MKHVMERVEKCLKMLRESGKKPYLIPSGGLGKAGIWVWVKISNILGKFQLPINLTCKLQQPDVEIGQFILQLIVKVVQC